MKRANTVIQKFKDAPIQIIDGDRGKNYPIDSELLDEGYCLFLNTGNVTDAGFNFNNCQFVSFDKDQILRKGKLKRNDLVMTTRGTVGNVGYYNNKVPFENIRINSGMVIFRVDQDEIMPSFLYQYLRSNYFNKQVNALRTGAAQPQLPIRDIKCIKIQMPQIAEQEKIADILSAYDDLIDTNRRRIQLLEESARLLFREWFVYFRFPLLRQGFGGQAGHEKACPVESRNSTGVKIIDGVPEGWKKEKLIKIGYLNYGKALVEETREEGDVKVYGSSGVVGVHSNSLVEGPGIIVGRKGNVGAIHWVNDNYWPIDTVYYIKKEQSNLFLYLSLKIIGFINTDASVPGLNRDYAHNKTILVPTKDLLDKFLNQVNDIYSMVKILTIQNQKLAQARDLLLPRLMSGAIDPVRYDKLSNGVEV